MKKGFALFMALAMIASFMGCATGSQNTTNAPAAAAQPAEQGSAAATTETATAEKIDNAVVTVELKADPGTFDPFGSSGEEARRPRFLVFQTLFFYRTASADPEPLLAKSYVKEDDLTYTITLNENICDSEGNPFTAKDVLFSLKTQKETGTQANTLNYVDIDACEVIDDLTIKIVMTQQVVESFEALIGRIPMCTEAAYTADADHMTNVPVGTGPYKLESWIVGSQIVLVKNDKYWRADGNDQNAEKILLKVIAETAQRGIEMETGNVDILYDCSADDFARFQADPAKYTTHVVDAPNMGVLVFNCSENSVCADKNIRQAVAYAVDSNAIIAAAFRGYGKVAKTLCGPAFREWNDSMENSSFYDVDLEKAKALLADAGHADGLTLRFMVDDGSTSQAIAQIVQASLSQIGVTVQIDSYEAAVYSSNIKDPTMFDIYYGTTRSDLSAMSLFNNRLNQKGSNRAFYINDEFQAMVDKCVASPSQAEIDALLAMFNEEIPLYPIAQLTELYVTVAGVEDFNLAVGSYIFPGQFTYTADFHK